MTGSQLQSGARLWHRTRSRHGDRLPASSPSACGTRSRRSALLREKTGARGRSDRIKPFNDFKTGIFTVVKSSGTMHIWSSAGGCSTPSSLAGQRPPTTSRSTARSPGTCAGRDISGSGVLYRPGGTVNTRVASNVATSYVSIRVMPVEGLFTKLATGPVRFDTCEELRSAEWRGIGEPTAHDRVTAGLRRPTTLDSTPATTCTRDDTGTR